MVTQRDLLAVKDMSIVSYLSSVGHTFQQIAREAMLTSSPFSSDTDPSFVVYADNKYKCWSTGKAGDIVDIVREIEGKTFQEAVDYLKQTDITKTVPRVIPKPPFDLNKYRTDNPKHIEVIKRYAESRGIFSNYVNGVYYRMDTSDPYAPMTEIPAMLFPHRDNDLKICGAKMRNCDPTDKERWAARGTLNFSLMYYKTPHSGSERKLYIMESETSACSLYQWLVGKEIDFVIMCIGAVSNTNVEVPPIFDNIPWRRVIIDYDGSAEKFEKRKESLSHLGTVIALELPQGEDVNSVYQQNKLDNYKSILL